MSPAWDVPTEIADVTIVNTDPIVISGTVTANQGTSPWVVTGTVSPVTAATSVVTRVPSSLTNQTLAVANSLRKGLTFYNHSTADQYIKFGTTATTTDFTVIMTPRSFYEVLTPVFVGQIDFLSSSTNGAVQVTELS
jgi:hypothetical protein